jgi:hypothetical protein
MACIYAYRAYSDQDLLALAEDVWASAVLYQITQDDAKARRHPQRNVTIPSTCNGRELISINMQLRI